MLYDERYTTQEAQMRMKMENIQGLHQYSMIYSKIKCDVTLSISLSLATLDAMSACCLLERYLQEEGDGSLDARPTSYPPPKSLEIFDYNIVRKHMKVDTLIYQQLYIYCLI